MSSLALIADSAIKADVFMESFAESNDDSQKRQLSGHIALKALAEIFGSVREEE